MESKLFSRFDSEDKENEQFAKDLRELFELSEDQRASVLSALPGLARAKTPVAQKAVLDALEAETGLTFVVTGHAIDMLRFFVDKMLADSTKGDTPEAWAADLRTLKLLDARQAKAFKSYFETLRTEFLPELERIRQAMRYGAGVLPSLSGAGVTVELRGVFEDAFHWGTSVDNYRPELRDLVAVVSVLLRMDAGSPSEIWFQATPDEIDLLIDELRAARKQAEVLQTRALLSEK